jgi:hypothetical protein
MNLLYTFSNNNEIINSYYCLESSYNFMIDSDISNIRNEENLNIATMYNEIVENINNINNINNLNLYDLIKLTDIKLNKIQNYFYINDLTHIFNFDNITSKSSYIIYYNNIFFSIFVNVNGKYKFSIRNSNLYIQNDFETFLEFEYFIKNNNIFGKNNNIFGNNANLQIIQINKKFSCDINNLLGISLKPTYNIVENTEGYIDIDNTITSYNSEGEDSIFI